MTRHHRYPKSKNKYYKYKVIIGVPLGLHYLGFFFTLASARRKLNKLINDHKHSFFSNDFCILRCSDGYIMDIVDEI